MPVLPQRNPRSRHETGFPSGTPSGCGTARHNPRSSTWEVFPRTEEQGYLLTFALPDRVEERIARNGRERQAARAIKEDLLPSLLIYRFADERPEVIRLTYGPATLLRP